MRHPHQNYVGQTALGKFVEDNVHAIAATAPPEPPALPIRAALEEVTALYHMVQKHPGHWRSCAKVTCRMAVRALKAGAG